MKTYELNSKKESGFTLVELAIVMIIIGLLIGGILKGQELIANARIAAAVSQLKGVDSAVSTFRDAYNAFPGDMTAANAAARIPNCAAAPCNTGGNADGRLANAPSVVPTLALEGDIFWAQLAAADIMGGIVPQAAAIALGQSHPEFEIGAGLRAGYIGTGALANRTAAAAGRAGHYIGTGNLGAISGSGVASFALSPGQAFRIDTRIDDGQPNTGSVMGAGAAAAGGCASAGAVTGVYNTALDQALCDIYMRIQG